VTRAPSGQRLARNAEHLGRVGCFDHFFLHGCAHLDQSSAFQKSVNSPETKKPEQWRYSRRQFGLSSSDAVMCLASSQQSNSCHSNV
jgi:hypothetical protein